MESEPQPVLSWKGPVGFVGWLLLMTGTFTIILGCGNLTGHPCSFSLVERSLIITSVGAVLLMTQWIEWGEEEGKGTGSTPRSRLKKLLLFILIAPLVAIVLALLAAIGGP